MILVKFIAQSGYRSRRKSEECIKVGLVCINGFMVIDPTVIVKPDDKVTCDGKHITHSNRVYAVINKPIECITTKDDPEGRTTVMDFMPAWLAPVAETLDPIGRLDFHTSGVLLLTNDGALANSLSHPKFKVSKTYEVITSRSLDSQLIDTLRNGVALEDGFVRPDKVMWNNSVPNRIVLTLHSGKNRVIKRILERLNIFVKKLHRREFAGITVEDLKPGQVKYLTKIEVARLKGLSIN